jgi:hypothetical protein
MRKATLALAAIAACTGTTTLAAQSGPAIKAHYVFNESKIDDARSSGVTTIPSADGFSVGVEYVLPMGIGVGVNAYTEGKATDVDSRTSSFAVVAEANYFARLPIIPLRPYAGVHAGIGRYTIDDVSGGTASPSIKDSRTQLGYQVGVRWQLTPMLGIDGQFRHVSDSASEDQSPDLERNQFLLGITLF